MSILLTTNDFIQILQVASAILTPVLLYVAFSRGTGKTVDIALDRIEKRAKGSPTAIRLLKIAEMTDKLFGDDQAIEQITRFFTEARCLVSGDEAKNFFKNASEALKSMTTEQPSVKIKLPERKEKK